MPAILGLKNGEQIALSRGDRLSFHGWSWSSGSYRSFESNGDYFNGYTKQNVSDIIIVKISSGVISYIKTAAANWANRESLTYGTFASLGL